MTLRLLMLGTVSGLLVMSATNTALAAGLVAVDSNRNLYEIDMSTGAKTLIGVVSANAGTTGGLAYDRVNDIVYVTSTSNDSLYTLNVTTGAATLVGAYGDPGIVMHGLEIGAGGAMYGASGGGTTIGNIYSISTANGLATLIGNSGLAAFTNLGYNSDTGVMYGINTSTDSFYSVNTANATATLIGAMGAGISNPHGLAYNWDNGQMYMIDSSTDMLYTINMATGAATVIGSTGTGNLLGLVYLGAVPGPGSLALFGLAIIGRSRRRS